MSRRKQENPGVSQRAASVAVFTVDSSDRRAFDIDGSRVDNTPVNKFIISKPQTLINGYFTRIALTELNFPWDVPNVNATNNTFTVILTAGQPYDGQYTVSVPEAFYTPSELAIALENALNAKMVEINATAEFVFDVSIGNNQNFIIENTEADGIFAIILKNAGQQDDLCNLMGFSDIPAEINGSPLVAALKFTGAYASMLYTPFIDIASNNLTKKQDVSDSSSSFNTGRSLLARIYLTREGIQQINTSDEEQVLGCRPFTIYKEFTTPKQIYWDTEEFVNIIDITLTDYKGNVLYESPAKLVDGEFTVGSGSTNFQLTFQVSET